MASGGAEQIERCEECGFDGARWSDAEAVSALAELPAKWARTVDGLDVEDLRRRYIPQMWSIAEFTDHVRETIFGMRFLLDTALSDPGSELGDPPEPRFDPEPRAIDVPRALEGFANEVRLLHDALQRLPDDQWSASVVLAGQPVDARWIVRHAVHDVTHHLCDIERLRQVSLGP